MLSTARVMKSLCTAAISTQCQGLNLKTAKSSLVAHPGIAQHPRYAIIRILPSSENYPLWDLLSAAQKLANWWSSASAHSLFVRSSPLPKSRRS